MFSLKKLLGGFIVRLICLIYFMFLRVLLYLIENKLGILFSSLKLKSFITDKIKYGKLFIIKRYFSLYKLGGIIDPIINL